ncbi:MAG: 30S ribosomal protein S17 [bacterium]|nr:30S ribosomal protein S17 [bacterium]
MEERARRKSQVGVVTSDKMAKTVVVKIEVVTRHPLYKKIVRRSKTLKAHDEQGTVHVGDRVRIVETRPLSRDKRWRVAEIIERAR